MSKPSIKSGNFTFTWNEKCGCYQFSLPPRDSCPGVNERLRNPRTVCSYCYAAMGRFASGNARALLQRNLKTLEEDRDVDLLLLSGVMTATRKHSYFRWFGSGDCVTVRLWAIIRRIAEVCPSVKFWMPTQNFWLYSLIDCRKTPRNLVVRATQPILGKQAPDGGLTTLLPGQGILPGHYRCPGKCEGCRKCWSRWNWKTRIAFPFHGSACAFAKLNKARRIYKF